MFRLYTLTFLGGFRGTHEQEHHLHESPSAMTIPLIVLAILSVIGGWVGIPELFAKDAHSLEHFLAPIFAGSAAIAEQHHLEASQEWAYLIGSTLLIVAVIVWAVSSYKKYQPTSEENTGISKVLENKWYVDELYDAIIVNPLNALGGFFKNFVEKNVIDAGVNGVGKLVGYGSRQLRLLQSGQVGNYLLIMVLAIVVFVLVWFNDITIMYYLNRFFKMA
jgi:NADH-quinone oxidoreductase subunit L